MSTADDPAVVLVETSAALPGLLPFQAWDALALAETIYVRDPDRHPSAEHLWFAGLELEQLAPAELDRRDLDLSKPGSPEDRRLAKALLERADEEGRLVYLLGPDDEQLTRVVGRESVDHAAEVEMVFLAQAPRGTDLLRLVEVMAKLRDPDEGCPWDLEQDHESLLPNLVEETYELVDAIEGGRDDEIREELGDVLLQVVFHAQMAADRRAFGIDDVARTVTDKLVRRHPHVFGELDVDDVDEVKANWDDIKETEKGRQGPFEGVPAALPALQLAQKLQRRGARAAPDPWTDPAARLRDAAGSLEGGQVGAEEIVALLEATVALARSAGVDAEQALRASTTSFRDDMAAAVALAREEGVDPTDADSGTWEALWERATGAGPGAGQE